MRLVGWLALVLSVVGCVPKSQYTKLEHQLEQCREGKKKGAGEMGEIVRQLQPLVDRGVLEVEDVDGRTVIGMKAEVLFPSGSAALSDDGRATVKEIGRVLGTRTDLNWQIEGHTDNEAINTAEFPDNWHLGAARAIAVLDVLVHNGLAVGRVSAATFGEYTPVASNDTPAGRAQNRRIEIVLLPEVRKRRLNQ
jgi:chemotaxis protein MotB